MKVMEIEAHGTDAMWEMVNRFEDAELEVEVFRAAGHVCLSLKSFEVPGVSLLVRNAELSDECDDCAREITMDARDDALMAA